MDVDQYLGRIAYRGALTPDANTLRDLHYAHLLAVPFENLDIHAHQPISLDEDLLYQKIVVRRRGGFCYELNGLFACLLERLGYKVTRLAAGVFGNGGNFSPEFDHMALLVHLEQDYLVDVGFGDCFLTPLVFDLDRVQTQGHMDYRITRDGNHYILMRQNQRDAAPTMRAQYRFRLQAHALDQYTAMCRYHQASPDSHFTQKRICSRATPDGRISLTDMKLIQTINGERSERMLQSEQEATHMLAHHFEITL